jgi:hypothetical protein
MRVRLHSGYCVWFVLISLQDLDVRVAGCAPQCYAVCPYGFDDGLVE